MPFRKSEAGAGGFHSEQSSNIWSADKAATGEGTAKRVQAHMHALSCMEKTYPGKMSLHLHTCYTDNFICSLTLYRL